MNRRFRDEKPGFAIGIEFCDTADRINEFVGFVESKTQVDGQEYWYLLHLKRTDAKKP